MGVLKTFLKRLRKQSEPTSTEKKSTDSSRGDEDYLSCTSQKPGLKNRRVEVNIGLDFGTRFTKIIYRDIGSEKSHVVYLPSLADSDGYIESIVSINTEGPVTVGAVRSELASVKKIDYLKMRLLGEQYSGLPPCLPVVESQGDKGLRALSSFFLANVIRLSMAKIREDVAAIYGDVEIGWSANIGVPVEHYHDDFLRKYREVFVTAWHWSESVHGEMSSLAALVSRYDTVVGQTQGIACDCFAQPEVVAGLHALHAGQRIEAGPRPYVFADVGAGTVDLVSFALLSNDGQLSANMYKGRVENIGTCIVAEKRLHLMGEGREALLFEYRDWGSEEKSGIHQDLALAKNMLVEVCKCAKDVRSDIWCRRSRSLQPEGRWPLNDMRLLPIQVFLGGGGSHSPIYRDVLVNTYEERRLKAMSLPPFEIVPIPLPQDLEFNGEEFDFSRYCVAYGLSYPEAQFISYKRPDDFGPEYAAPKRKPKAPDFGNTKDLC